MKNLLVSIFLLLAIGLLVVGTIDRTATDESAPRAPMASEGHDVRNEKNTVAEASHVGHEHLEAKHAQGIAESGHDHSHDRIDQEKLERLIDKHISDDMRAEINEALRPGGQPPRIVEIDGHRVLDTSDRAATVMVGIIDEEEGLIVTDFMQPLPERNAAQ